MLDNKLISDARIFQGKFRKMKTTPNNRVNWDCEKLRRFATQLLERKTKQGNWLGRI